MGKKQKDSGTLPNKKDMKALQRMSPVMRPLLEMFAVVDDVMTEHDAFAPGQIHKSLGRIYRGWLDSREALDPEFDRERYRHEMKGRKKAPTTPLGRELRASGSLRSSTDPRQTSEKSPKKSGKNGKRSAKRSVEGAPSADRASSGHSKKKSRSASGEASHSESVSGSGSGSKKRATPRSPKAKDEKMRSKSSEKKKPKSAKREPKQSSTPAESDSRSRRPCAPGPVMGLDLSLTGCGVVVLSKKGKPLAMDRFQTSPIASATAGKEAFHGLRPSGVFVGSSEARIHWLAKQIRKLCKQHDVCFVLIEDHAFAAKGRGKTVLGELHGVVKNRLWKDEVAFDLKTPQAIKKHATGNGRAEKIDVIYAAKAAGFDISDSDRADAWGAADMALRCYTDLVE